MLLQKGIALREMAAAKKALISRKRTGMRGREHQVMGICDALLFGRALAPHSRNTIGSCAH